MRKNVAETLAAVVAEVISNNPQLTGYEYDSVRAVEKGLLGYAAGYGDVQSVQYVLLQMGPVGKDVMPVAVTDNINFSANAEMQADIFWTKNKIAA